MKAFALIVIAAASGFSPDTHAACELPVPTAVKVLPDGATATEQDMFAARAEISAYVEAAKAYVACIDLELDLAKQEGASAEFNSILVNRRNAAVTEQEAVAQAFNRQLQAFKAAHPETQAASQPASSTGSGAGAPARPQ
jgi:hypothetical protein